MDESGRIFDTADLTNRLYRPNLKYPVTDPTTGRVIESPENGWAIEKSNMEALIADGSVSFNGSLPRRKKFLDEYMSEMPIPTFSKVRSTASSHLEGVLGDKRFPNPKDHNVLMRWFRMVAPKDAVVLDFFGGSGTTAEAVIRLNAEDGGTRQSILVTNNELSAKDDAALRKAGHEPGSPEYEAQGVFHNVTKPRIETVVSGTRQDGSKYSDGLPGQVTFFDLEYLDADRIADDRAFEAVLPMLWMRAGAPGTLATATDDEPWLMDGRLAVLRDASQWEAFAEALSDDVTHAFVVTNSSTDFSRAARAMPVGVEVVRLYEKYLTTFEINTAERAL